MTNPFQMMKQLNELRKLQKEMESKTNEAASRDGLVAVVARGDMTIKSIRIDPKAMDVAKPDKLAQLIVSTANAALDGVKRAAAKDVAKLSGGLGGLSQMMGG
jgi:nucleoid-associated protein EbfC